MESIQLKSPPKKKKDKVELAEIKKKCQSIKTNVQLRSMPPKSNLEEPIGDTKKSKYDPCPQNKIWKSRSVIQKKGSINQCRKEQIISQIIKRIELQEYDFSFQKSNL